ncbi:hypothetical protein A2U01_0096826, partial [Trifolium medium]|nr:hypothetical protein [Trifolium medium]
MNALNAVCFGHYRVRASLARFDRNVTGVGKSPGTEKGGLLKPNGGLVKEDRNHKSARPEMHKGDEDRTVTKGKKAKG